jgi:neutral trehalase
MENSNCDIDISTHALRKHDPDTSKYVGIRIEKVFEVLRECICKIFEKGKTQPVSARWREVGKERRSNIVKYLKQDVSCCGCQDLYVLHRCCRSPLP